MHVTSATEQCSFTPMYDFHDIAADRTPIDFIPLRHVFLPFLMWHNEQRRNEPTDDHDSDKQSQGRKIHPTRAHLDRSDNAAQLTEHRIVPPV